MSERPHLSPPFAQALDTSDWERVEELWLEALDRQPVPIAELLEVRRRLYELNQKSLARTLLELAADNQEAAGDPAGALATLREVVRLTDKPGRSLLSRLEAALRDSRAGSPSRDAVLERYDLVGARKPLEVLEEMETWLSYDTGTVVEVQGQGVGRVVDVNLELGNIKVDIGAAKPVSVPFGAAARYLRRLPEGDFLRRKVEEPEVLTEWVREAPGEALAEILTSLETPTDVAAIKGALDGILPASAWSSWWAKARKHPRIMSSGSGSRLKYEVTTSAASATEAMLDELAAAEARERLAVARRLAARGPDAAAATGAYLADSLSDLEASDPGLAWETTEVLTDLPGGEQAAAASRARLLETVPVLRMLEGIAERTARQTLLEAVRESRPASWAETWAEWFLHEDSNPLLDHIAATLVNAGAEDQLDDALEAVFRSHESHAAAFMWACEAMASDTASEPVRRRRTVSLLEKLPDTLAKPEFSAHRSRAKALLDPGGTAILLVLEAANAQQAARFAQRISRLDVVEPDRQRVVQEAAARRQTATPTESEEPMLVATRPAIDRRRAELKQLLEVEIPKTLKGINAAAAEGDLRENFEYHMLRDRQELQSAKAAKLQRELGQVRVLEPGAADTSAVNIGTVVHFDDADPVTILGVWDADVAARVFANGAGLSQQLLGHEVGDRVTVEGRTTTITAIEPWTG